MSSPQRIALAGWYGYGNVGDDLLLRELSRAIDPVAVFSTQAGWFGDREIHDVARLPEFVDSIDLLLIGGGGLLNNRWVARLPLEQFGRPYGFLSVGVPHAKWLGGMDEALAGARFVTVRDHLALELLREAYPSLDAWWLPDPGFMLAREDALSARPLVVLNPRAIPAAWRREEDPADPETQQVGALSQVIWRHGHRADFLAIGFEETDRPLIERLPCESRIVGLDEAVPLIASSTAVVTARLHGGIVAATQGKPVALIDYQDKIRGLAQLLNLPAYSLASLGGCDTVVDDALSGDASRDPSPAVAYGELTARFLTMVGRSP